MSYNYVHIVTDNDWKLFGILPSSNDSQNHITLAELSPKSDSVNSTEITHQIIKNLTHNTFNLKPSDICGTISNRSVFSKDNVLVGLSFT